MRRALAWAQCPLRRRAAAPSLPRQAVIKPVAQGVGHAPGREVDAFEDGLGVGREASLTFAQQPCGAV